MSVCTASEMFPMEAATNLRFLKFLSFILFIFAISFNETFSAMLLIINVTNLRHSIGGVIKNAAMPDTILIYIFRTWALPK